MVILAKSSWRMMGCARSQSMMTGFSRRPNTSSGTSGGTALTSTKRPLPTREGLAESMTTTSEPSIPP